MEARHIAVAAPQKAMRTNVVNFLLKMHQGDWGNIF
jgi:hypothetical protein